jgi:hypothetical protein
VTESYCQSPALASRPLPEQLHLFADATRWPRRPYCTHDPEAGLRIRSLASALRHPYIQANPPSLRVWSIFDVDRPAGGLAWEDALLPPPSWVSVNRANGHAHLVWGLSVPVLVESAEARQAPIRYLVAVEQAFRAGLQADSGYGGLITKNPAHPLWWTLRGPTASYELGYLAEWVDLPKHLPRRGAKVEEVGLGRNCILFDWLRRWSYEAVRQRRADRNYVLWQAQVYDRALERNGEFLHPLTGREVWHIARSVTKWVWARDAKAEAAFVARQAWKGQRSGEVRRAASEDRRARALQMASERVSQRRIAAELGVTQKTVSIWLRSDT